MQWWRPGGIYGRNPVATLITLDGAVFKKVLRTPLSGRRGRREGAADISAARRGGGGALAAFTAEKKPAAESVRVFKVAIFQQGP